MFGGYMTTHQFDVAVAKEYGIQEAILLQNIAFWVQKNAANNKQVYDGNVWTYNSVKAFAELFPYMSEKQIYNALKKLENEGLIVTGNYNKSAYDRTKWYALTEKACDILGISIFPLGKIQNQNWENQNYPEGEPIPDNKPDDKPDNKPDDKKKGATAPKEKHFFPPTIQEIKDYAHQTNKPDYSEQFFNYYESIGWLVGRNKMKKWKSAYAGWCTRQNSYGQPNRKQVSAPTYSKSIEETNQAAMKIMQAWNQDGMTDAKLAELKEMYQ